MGSLLGPLLAALSACGGASTPPITDLDGGADQPFFEDSAISTASPGALDAVANGPLVLDYDLDGDLDLFVVGGYDLVDPRAAKPVLLQNDGKGRFVDVTAASGLGKERLLSTAAAFDYDNDGDPDLFLAGADQDALYRNNGDGTFLDITILAGIATDSTTFTAAVADVDNDSLLDIYIPLYGELGGGFGATGGPTGRKGKPDLLYRNNGDGTFSEESQSRGLGAGNPEVTTGPGDDQGVAALFWDFDGDFDLDLLVASDGGYMLLYRNEGGTFLDVSEAAGIRAVGFGGWMGLAPIDLDDDGGFEVVVNNVGTTYLTFDPAVVGEEAPDFHPYAAVLKYRGDGAFENVAEGVQAEGLPAIPSVRPDLVPPRAESLELLPWGWGISDLDFDNDGLDDLYVTGSLGFSSGEGVIGSISRGAYPGLLLRRTGPQAFRDVTLESGVADVGADGFILPAWGNSVADLDDDGFTDLVIGNQRVFDIAGSLRIFLNNLARLGSPNHWIEFAVQGSASNRDAIGAEVRVFTSAEGPPQVRGRFVMGWSYACVPLHFGLGAATSVARVEIRWPSGRVQELTDLAADQRVALVEP